MRTLNYILALTLVLTVFVPGAQATNHLTQIDEVMPGAFGRSEIQFVEVKFLDCSQNNWGPDHARLVFFDAQDNQVGEFLFPSDPPADCLQSGQSALIATQAFADLPSAPTPDFVMPADIVPSSGKVCFKDGPALNFSVDLCLSYGGFTGNTEEESGTNAPTLDETGICTWQRVANNAVFGDGIFGSNDNDDFALRAPEPRNTSGTVGSVSVPPRFSDVTKSHLFFPFIEALFNAGVTSGCGGGKFCPGDSVTREQMAVFLLAALEGDSLSLPPCTTPTFSDVSCSSPFAPFIEELAARGITSGCGGGKFCPKASVTREQMAVFLLATLEGGSLSLPPCTTPTFSDVSCANPFAPFIEELVDRGITSGCGGGNFCPKDAVTRGQMAVFLSATFDLPVPTTGCP